MPHTSVRRRQGRAMGAVLLAALLGLAPQASTQPRAAACGDSAKPADFSLVLLDMDGAPVRLEDYRGKVLVLHFWATWCVTCGPELQALDMLQQTHAARGVRVLAVSIDDAPEAMRTFAKAHRLRYPLLEGRGRADLTRAYGPVFGVPTTVMVSRDGRICRRLVGPATLKKLERSISGLL